MRIDKAVAAVTKYVPENIFEETVSAFLPSVIENLDVGDAYPLRVAYALAACDQIRSAEVGCAWYDMLWAWTKENVDAEHLDEALFSFSAAYVDSITVTEGTERLRVEIELPHSFSGVENVEEHLAHLMRMLSGAKNVKAVESDEDKRKFKFDFEGVNARDVLNLLIKSLAAISGVLAIVDSSELPPSGAAGWIKKQITLARMAIALIGLVIGLITGQIADVNDVGNILDGTPIYTLTPLATTTPSPSPTATEEGLTTPIPETPPFITFTPEPTGEPYPVPTAVSTVAYP